MAWTPLPELVELTVETPKPKEFALDPAKTAVIVVDMQNKSRGNPRTLDVIEGNQRLVAKAREAGAKVMHVQSLRQLDSPTWMVFNRRPFTMLPGTWNVETIEELAPLPGEPVIKKWSHDVWAWHGIESVLEREGIVAGEWTVLVTGVSAAACAEAAALGFANRLYRTLIPLDCTAAGIEQEARTYAMYMSPAYSFNMDFTLSTKVNFQGAAVEARERVLTPTA